MKKTLLLLGLLSMMACKSDKKENSEKEKEEDSFVISDSAEKTKDDSPLAQSIERGKKIYTGLCVACHMPNGKGMPGTYPPLDGSNWLTEKREAAIHGVKYGLQGEVEVNGEKYNNVMTPMGLSDQEVADALNYVMHSWSNNIDEMVTAEEVSKIEK